MNARCIITLVCPRCGHENTIVLDNVLWKSKSSVRCQKCGVYIWVNVSIEIDALDIADDVFDEFERWLAREKRITSARQYRVVLERLIKERKFPRPFTVVEYFEEFMRTVKGRSIKLKL